MPCADSSRSLAALHFSGSPTITGTICVDVGITGRDWILEAKANVEILLDLEIGRVKRIYLKDSKAVLEIAVPPLRERSEDIVPLAERFLRQHATRYRKSLTGFDTAAMQALLRHSWPGNIRELDHAADRQRQKPVRFAGR